MLGGARFGGLLLVSVGVHLAALYSLGWRAPVVPDGSGALHISLAAPLIVSSPVPVVLTPESPSVALRPLALDHAAPRQLITQSEQAKHQVRHKWDNDATTVATTPVAKAVATPRATELAVASLAMTEVLPPAEIPLLPETAAVPMTTSPVVASAQTVGGAAESPVTGQDERQASVGRQLLAALQDHFSYPLRARRKGWEGDVLLGVDLDEAGGVAEVRLLASSGYATLDRAAVASMRAVGALEQYLSGRLTVEVPVRYRLIN